VNSPTFPRSRAAKTPDSFISGARHVCGLSSWRLASAVLGLVHHALANERHDSALLYRYRDSIGMDRAQAAWKSGFNSLQPRQSARNRSYFPPLRLRTRVRVSYVSAIVAKERERERERAFSRAKFQIRQKTNRLPFCRRPFYQNEHRCWRWIAAGINADEIDR